MSSAGDYEVLLRYGPLGLFIVLLLTGRIVPSFIVDRYKEELEEARREIRELRAKLERKRH